MAKAIRLLKLEVSQRNILQTIFAKQYDTDSRFLKIQLMNGTEQIIINPTSIVTINAKRSDNSAKAFAGVVNDDGTVTVPITYWMLELDDKVSCDVSVVDAQGRKLSTLNFTIEVEHSNYSGDDISEDENYDLIPSILAQVAETNDAVQYKSNKPSVFESGNLPQLDDNGDLVDSGESIDSIKDYVAYVAQEIVDLPNVHHYGARWNKTQAQMTRLYDAASFTTTTTNFGHFGSVNANYSNPFDSIYPWSGIRLCNIDLNLYANLAAGSSITKCVKAWEGDPDFSYEDENGVWRYRPEFYGKSWEDDTYRYFDVSERAIGSYVHYPEAIVGRWHGRAISLTIDDAQKTCLIPSVGVPAMNIGVDIIHTYAKNYGATLDSIYSIDADILLCIVEYATMNTQKAIGNGVMSVYRQSSDRIAENVTNSNVVKVLASAASAYCIPGAIFDIGTSNGGNQVGTYHIVSVQDNAGDYTYLDVTLNKAVTVTTANYWSVRGNINVADDGIGSKSGYIGVNGKCNAYYRGMVLFGNMFLYTLGAYERAADGHIWIANSDEEADNYDAINTEVHYDTGLVLPTASGYIKKLGMLSRSGLLSVPTFCTETGGDSNNPVGDYFWNSTQTNNTVLVRGGTANYGANVGAFGGSWYYASSFSIWSYAARPRLKNP